MHPDLPRYAKACEFPGELDEVAVESHLARYLDALGVQRKIERLRCCWTFKDYPELEKYVNGVLAELKPVLDEIDTFEARAADAARAARAPLDALGLSDARDALAAIAANAADADLSNWGPGIAHTSDDEIEAGALDAARKALIVGASILPVDELTAIAARAARDTTFSMSRHAVRPASTPSLAAASLVDAATRAVNVRDRAILAARNPINAIEGRYARAALDACEAERVFGEPVDSAFHARNNSVAIAAMHAHGNLNVRDARAARNSRDALHRFASWCIQSGSWNCTDVSCLATQWFGATTEMVKSWSQPIFEAYVAGAWTLHWTEETLFWVAKPRLHLETAGERPRLHCSDGPAIESDVENLYFWHGVRVPAFVLTRPERITVEHIRSEENAEVRRIMIERYGPSRFILDSKAKVIHQDEFGTLYRAPLENDEPLVMVRVVNSTPEPDGSHREYFLRVPPVIRRAREAVAWTFGLREMEYSPKAQT